MEKLGLRGNEGDKEKAEGSTHIILEWYSKVTRILLR